VRRRTPAGRIQAPRRAPAPARRGPAVERALQDSRIRDSRIRNRSSGLRPMRTSAAGGPVRRRHRRHTAPQSRARCILKAPTSGADPKPSPRSRRSAPTSARLNGRSRASRRNSQSGGGSLGLSACVHASSSRVSSAGFAGATRFELKTGAGSRWGDSGGGAQILYAGAAPDRLDTGLSSRRRPA